MQTIVISIENGLFSGTEEQADEFARAVRDAVLLGLPRGAVEVYVNGESCTTVGEIAKAAANLRAMAEAAGRLAAAIGQHAMPTADDLIKQIVAFDDGGEG